MDRGAWQVPVHRVAKSQTTEMTSNAHSSICRQYPLLYIWKYKQYKPVNSVSNFYNYDVSLFYP